MCNFSGILYITLFKRKTKKNFHGAPEIGFVDVKTKDFIFVLYFLLALGTLRIFLQPNMAHPHLDFIMNPLPSPLRKLKRRIKTGHPPSLNAAASPSAICLSSAIAVPLVSCTQITLCNGLCHFAVQRINLFSLPFGRLDAAFYALLGDCGRGCGIGPGKWGEGHVLD